MIRAICIVVVALALTVPGRAADWVLQMIPAAGPVKAVDTVDGEPAISIGHGWFRVVTDTNRARLVATAGPPQRPKPDGALPDGRIAEGRGDIARAWLADPTERYGHAVLGDAIEAASVVVERRDRRRDTVSLGPDAVFEDLQPRIVSLGDGADKILVVKSYLQRGAALAVIGERDGKFGIVAETPPIGTANRWLNPAGVADFDGDGSVDVALVRMPHALGRLELWSWRGGKLDKTLELADVSNHAIGSRALRLSVTADFDGDGHPDLAIPSFDRRTLRLISFAQKGPDKIHDIARIALPSRVVTDFSSLKDEAGRLALVFGLENGALAMVRRPGR